MATNDTIPPPTAADLLAERIARLIQEARDAGLADGVIVAECRTRQTRYLRPRLIPG